MEVVKKTNRYTIFKKRNGRYGVRSAGGAWINGEDKVNILSEEGLIKPPKTQSKEEKGEAQEDQQDQAPEQEAPESSEEVEEEKESQDQQEATQ